MIVVMVKIMDEIILLMFLSAIALVMLISIITSYYNKGETKEDILLSQERWDKSMARIVEMKRVYEIATNPTLHRRKKKERITNRNRLRRARLS